jgi:PAS domain S-box-containing protein
MGDDGHLTLVILVLAASVALQCIAAVLAWRLVAVTGRRLAWLLISIAVLAMAVRRCITIVLLLTDGSQPPPSLSAESVALLTSALLVAGLIRIGPYFALVRSAERKTREINEQLVDRIAERRRELKYSESRYQMLVQNMGEAICVVDTNEVFLFANPAAERIFGVKPGTLVGMNLLDFLDAEGRQAALKQTATRRQMETSTYEIPIIRSNGERRHLLTTVSPHFDADGNYAGSYGISLDITERKRAEELLREMNVELERRVAERTEALRQSEERFRSLVETMQDGLGIHDEDMIITYANPSLCRMLGYTADEMVGRSVESFFDETNRRVIEEETQQRVSGKLTTYELSWIAKDGHEVITSVSPAPLYDAEGRFVGSFGVFTDITERKQAEVALRRSEVRLRSTIESLPFDFFVIDEDGRYLIQNTACQRHWGYLLGKTPADTAPDDRTRELWLANNRRAFAGETVESEVTYQHGDESRDCYNIIAPIRDGELIVGILGMNIDISERKLAERDRERLIAELQTALGQLKTLGGLLPICSYCKKIRDDQGYWSQLEAYFAKHSEAEFTHSICPDCARKRFPDVQDGGAEDDE